MRLNFPFYPGYVNFLVETGTRFPQTEDGVKWKTHPPKSTFSRKALANLYQVWYNGGEQLLFFTRLWGKVENYVER